MVIAPNIFDSTISSTSSQIEFLLWFVYLGFLMTIPSQIPRFYFKGVRLPDGFPA